MQPLGLTPPSGPRVTNIGGVLPIKSLSDMMREEEAANATAAAVARASETQAQPIMGSLVQHIRKHWEMARKAKLQPELDMLSAVRSRRGEYEIGRAHV